MKKNCVLAFALVGAAGVASANTVRHDGSFSQNDTSNASARIGLDGQIIAELAQWSDSGAFGVVASENASRSGGSVSGTIQRFADFSRSDEATGNGSTEFQTLVAEIVHNAEGAGFSMPAGNIVLPGNTGYGNRGPVDGGNGGYAGDDLNPSTSVPLPGTAAMAGLGLAGMATRRRRA